MFISLERGVEWFLSHKYPLKKYNNSYSFIYVIDFSWVLFKCLWAAIALFF